MAMPETMHAVELVGHGRPEMLRYRTDRAVPWLAPDEVLVQVGGAGLDKTDVNTRTGWYSKAVTSGTGEGTDVADAADASWAGRALELPRTQGADIVGSVVAVGDRASEDRLGERVLVRSGATRA